MNTPFWQKIDQSARSLTPFLLSIALVLISVLPLRVPGLAMVAPAFGLMAIYHWAIYRPNLLPLSAVFTIGILHDLLADTPVGLFALVFLTVYGISLTQRRFVAGKSFLIYWLGFAIIAGGAEIESWLLASAWTLSLLDPRAILFQYLVTIGIFPLVAWIFLKWQTAILTLE